MTAEHFIESNYHSKAGLEADKLIEDKTGKEVSFEEIAEAYHERKLKLLGIGVVSQQRELLEGFVDWFNANDKTQAILSERIEEYLKTL